MRGIQEEFGATGLEVIAIDIQPVGDGWSRWVDWWHSKQGGDVTWALDARLALARKYGILTLGQTVVIDTEGSVIYNGLPPKYDRLKELVEHAI